jgi:hypothetical protein
MNEGIQNAKSRAYAAKRGDKRYDLTWRNRQTKDLPRPEHQSWRNTLTEREYSPLTQGHQTTHHPCLCPGVV